MLLRKQDVEADALVDRLVEASLYEKPDTFDDTKSDMEAAVVVGNLADKLRDTGRFGGLGTGRHAG